MPKLRMGGPNLNKPYHTIYGRNRYSKNLITHSRNHRSLQEARAELRKVRESAGHDYTFRIKSHWTPILERGWGYAQRNPVGIGRGRTRRFGGAGYDRVLRGESSGSTDDRILRRKLAN